MQILGQVPIQQRIIHVKDKIFHNSYGECVVYYIRSDHVGIIDYSGSCYEIKKHEIERVIV